MIVGARFADNNGRVDSGSAYVIYGQAAADPADVDLLGVTTRAMRINGAAASDEAGNAVGRAGDFNDDGVADMIVGAPRAGTTAPGVRKRARPTSCTGRPPPTPPTSTCW